MNVWRTFAHWIDSERLAETVKTFGDKTRVVRGRGYNKPGSISCELTDTGNGLIARFPAHNSTEQDHYVCLGYDQARELVLALTPHAKELGFVG
jgi:hypothetical protein